MSQVIDVDGRAVPVAFRKNKQARRVIMRIDPKTDGVRITLPYGISEAEGLRFARTHTDWLRERLGAMGERVPLRNGSVIPILGVDHKVLHALLVKGGVWIDDEQHIVVTGAPEHVARRLTDWLRKEAKRRLTALATEKSRADR